MRPALPRYVDTLIAAWHAGLAGRDVHLGYWEQPPPEQGLLPSGAFAAAQGRLTERLLDLAPPRADARILDVGCGFGGTLEAIGRRVQGASLIGLNIDARQLQICRGLAPGDGNRLSLLAADAGALPLAAASIEQVTCVEAMFHFRSRAGFLAEAARVLRRGGTLALTDLVARHPQHASPWRAAVLEQALRHEYGPWPEIWITPEAIIEHADAAGLAVATVRDWSAATRPSYRVTAPAVAAPSLAPGAGEVMQWLHAAGWLRYVAMVFRRA